MRIDQTASTTPTKAPEKISPTSDPLSRIKLRANHAKTRQIPCTKSMYSIKKNTAWKNRRLRKSWMLTGSLGRASVTLGLHGVGVHGRADTARDRCRSLRGARSRFSHPRAGRGTFSPPPRSPPLPTPARLPAVILIPSAAMRPLCQHPTFPRLRSPDTSVARLFFFLGGKSQCFVYGLR